MSAEEIPQTYTNYRIVKKNDGNGNIVFAIHEVTYSLDPTKVAQVIAEISSTVPNQQPLEDRLKTAIRRCYTISSVSQDPIPAQEMLCNNTSSSAIGETIRAIQQSYLLEVIDQTIT